MKWMWVLAIVLVSAGAVRAADAPSDEERVEFLRRAAICIERPAAARFQEELPLDAHGLQPSWKDLFSAWQRLSLTAGEIEKLRSLLLAAMLRNQREEEQARHEGVFEGVVLGGVSCSFRLRLETESIVETGWMHCCGERWVRFPGWVEGPGQLGAIGVNESEAHDIATLLNPL